MKKFFRLMAVGTLVALASAGPVLAQDNTGGGATGSGDTTAGTEDRRDNGVDLGWLGLLGLAGLAGLRRPQQTVVHRDTTARP